jgi:hypothetical protein
MSYLPPLHTWTEPDEEHEVFCALVGGRLVKADSLDLLAAEVLAVEPPQAASR